MAARLAQRPQRVAGAAAQRERERAGAREREGERLGPRRAQLREDARELAELGGERVAAPRRQRRARILRRLAPVRRRRGGVGGLLAAELGGDRRRVRDAEEAEERAQHLEPACLQVLVQQQEAVVEAVAGEHPREGDLRAQKSARRIKLPNAMLESMVENLKAEVYEMRLRLMAKGVGESDSSSAGTHREEELQEGDIRGSFAEGRL